MMARNSSITMQNLVEIARRTSAWEDEMWCFHLVCLLRAGCAGIVFTHGQFFGFSPRRGDTLHRSRSNLAWRSSSLPNFALIGLGLGVYGPKTEKNWNFTNMIAPKGRVTCTIFTTFTSFMRELSLHNISKYGCFISINDKIINNLLRWERFQPNFRRPLAEKNYGLDPKKVWHQNDGTDHLYHRAKIGGNRATHVGARGWNVMFFTFFYLWK